VRVGPPGRRGVAAGVVIGRFGGVRRARVGGHADSLRDVPAGTGQQSADGRHDAVPERPIEGVARTGTPRVAFANARLGSPAMIDSSAGTPEIRLTDLSKHFR